MSADKEQKTIKAGVDKGACDYLIKPLREEELKNIWQHIVRKNLRAKTTAKVGQDDDDSSSAPKKPRVVWSLERHQKFINAVNHIGLDSMSPLPIILLCFLCKYSFNGFFNGCLSN